MVSVPIDWQAGAEIKWLTEVEAHLRHARALLSCLDDDLEISAHIDDALAQALSLRITRMIAKQEKIHPDWTESGL